MKNILKVNILISLIFFSLIIFQTRSLSEAEDSSISLLNLHKIISVVLLFAISIHFVIKNRFKTKKNKILIFYGLYIFIGLISTIFFSNWIGYSIWKLIEVSSVFFTVLYIYKLSTNNFYYLQYSFNLILKYYKFLIIISIIGVFILPDIAIRPPSQYQESFLPYMLHGAIAKINSNSLGMLAAIILFTSIVDYFDSNNKGKILLWIFISIIVLVFAQSRTALGSLLIILAGYLFFTNRISRFFKITITILSACLLYMNMNSILLYIGRGYDIQHLEKMSGRLDWWAVAWNTFIQSSFFEKVVGLGFGVANRTILRNIDFEEAASLHSDYVDALISSGFVGVTMLVFLVLIVVFNILKNKKIIIYSSFYLKLVGVSLLILIRSFTGTSIAFHNFFLIFFLIASIGIIEYPKVFNKRHYV